MSIETIVILTVAVGLLFAFVNGFHDGCNVIATVIASRSMKPWKALFVACLAEFVGPILLGTAVAVTIGKGIISPDCFTKAENARIPAYVLLSALSGGIIWNLITWQVGIPSSSSHALVGGLIGVGAFVFGLNSIEWRGVFYKVILVLFTSPVIGLLAGYFAMKVSTSLFSGITPRAGEFFKHIQLVSMAFLGMSHGTNDAQKSMGVITMALVVTGRISDFAPPLWVVVGCAAAISLGLSMGGWKIVRTVGTRIFPVKPLHSFNSQLAASSVIYIASVIGGPVSTTQIVSSSIMGVGAAKRLGAVRWLVVRNILLAWFITIPAAGLIGAGIYYLLQLVFPT